MTQKELFVKKMNRDTIIELEDYAKIIIRIIKRTSLHNECSIQLVTKSMEWCESVSDGRWYNEKTKLVECDFSLEELNYIKKIIKIKIVCYITTHSIDRLSYITISW